MQWRQDGNTTFRIIAHRYAIARLCRVALACVSRLVMEVSHPSCLESLSHFPSSICSRIHERDGLANGLSGDAENQYSCHNRPRHDWAIGINRC